MDSVIFGGKDNWLWPWFSLFRGRHVSLRKWAYNLKIIERGDAGTSCLSFGAQPLLGATGIVGVVVVLGRVQLFATPWAAACQASLSHYLPEFAQTHVRWVGDAIQPSHPLSPPTPPALNHSQHQGLFQWVGSSHQVVKIIGASTSDQSFQWIFRVDFL